MSQYDIIASMKDSTVVAEYKPIEKSNRACQTEADLERELIEILRSQGYEYLSIKSAEELKANLRREIERLNGIEFDESEWERFFTTTLANANEGIEEKTARFQEEPVVAFTRDDGTVKNIKIFDRDNIHNNRLQVVNQYVETSGLHENRYDVTILANGLPVVHVELKRRGVDLREAFNQIERYQRESFWAGYGLFEFVQLFVISNGTITKYYSNTTRRAAVNEHTKSGAKKKKKTSATFEFTSFWADAKNRVIPDLVDFARTFFAAHTLLNILAKYCVFTSDRNLLVMRPYQIAATERIIERIRTSITYKRWTGTEGGGYIWHTTGSGKTLTSFKTARLASRVPEIDKVLFVVDRKDLDYQTMKEYDRFEKGAANGNRSTAILKRQLEDRDKNGAYHNYRIIITTIQKLSTFIKKNPGHEISQKNVVLIFDECHRSQFGDMHIAIDKFFKKRLLFGFTGTPIFAKNAGSGKGNLRTTEQAFGEKLHAYNIVDAIQDENVLPFRVDYINTIKSKALVADEQIPAIDSEEAFAAPERIEKIVAYVVKNFDRKTQRHDRAYEFRKVVNIDEIVKNPDKREEKIAASLKGFNSIFAVWSIKAAKLYYDEFKRQLGERFGTSFKIATIFSYAPNEEESNAGTGLVDDENSDDTNGLDLASREFLDYAIEDYNAAFGTMYDTSAEKFPNYYKDVSQRMKNREIDMLIVVNMFLTGFDATTLNTLWVDKNLRMHGLLQAFSRTNRILNSIKKFGNIVCFRALDKEVDEALALFGDKEAGGVVLLKAFKDYYYGYTDDKGKKRPGYVELVDELLRKYPLDEPIVGEKNQKEFIKLFGSILRARNLLSTFDEFEGKEILEPLDYQDYQSRYLDLHAKYREKKEKENINDDLVFELELVKQVEVNIDYILDLVEAYCRKNREDKTILGAIRSAVDSSPALRSKKELIEKFVARVSLDADVRESWREFVDEERTADAEQIIVEEGLKPELARKFIKKSFDVGAIETNGTEIDEILPRVSIFAKNGGSPKLEKKEKVIAKLQAFFEKYFGLF